MRVEPDYTEAQQADSPPDDGRYVFRVARVAPKTRTTQDGAKVPYLCWTLRVAKGEWEGREVELNTNIGGPYAWVTQSFVSLFDPSYVEGGFDTDDIVGKLFEADIQNEEYQGKRSKWPKVRNWGPYVDDAVVPSVGAFDAMEDDGDIPF